MNVDGDALRRGAVDGGAWELALLGILASPVSRGFSEAVLRDCCRMLFGGDQLNNRDQRAIQSMSAYIDKRTEGTDG